jgi:urease accessory protein
MPTGIEPRQLLLLLNWMSPAFPIGGFAYSHGLEWAIEDGQVKTASDVKDWIEDVVMRGSGWNDAVLFARCWEDDAGELNELALALAASQERWLETTRLGSAFEAAAAVFGLGPHPACRPPSPICKDKREKALDDCRLLPCSCMGEGARRADEGALAYPVAAGWACARMGIEKSHALLAFLQGFSNALISVAVRLVPLGQAQGLAVMRDMLPLIEATAERAGAASLDDLGAIVFLSDIAAMKHETQHSRIFRS